MKLLPLLALMIHLGHCCLNNFDSAPPKIWRKFKGIYTTNIFITPKQSLRNWTLKLVFQQPLVNSIKTSKGLIESENKEKTIVVLKSKNEDSLIKDENEIMLSVAFQEKIDGAVIKCAEFCGYLKDNEDENICQIDGDLEKRSKKSKKKESKKGKKNKRKKNKETKIKKKKYRYMSDDTTKSPSPKCLNNIVFDYRTQ